MATPEDRSLGNGTFFPKWMKTKINDKFDLDQNTFSPPDHDEGFKYFHHLKALKTTETSTETVKSTIVEPVKPNRTADFSKHPTPCQKYLNSNASFVSPNAADGKVRPNGIDDGFKGEAAKCGSSIIRVAHQMVADKVVHSFNLEERDTCDPDLKYFDPHKRRGSKSLPASPLGSPQSRRKINSYFAGSYAEGDKPKTSWMLTTLLTRSKLSQSVGSIGEEPHEDIGGSTMSINATEDKGLKAKPSELREMNFWSPTSM